MYPQAVYVVFFYKFFYSLKSNSLKACARENVLVSHHKHLWCYLRLVACWHGGSLFLCILLVSWLQTCYYTPNAQASETQWHQHSFCLSVLQEPLGVTSYVRIFYKKSWSKRVIFGGESPAGRRIWKPLPTHGPTNSCTHERGNMRITVLEPAIAR